MINKYINMLVFASHSERHELVEECLVYYGVCGTRELTAEQVREFCVSKGLLM